ncbi:MAG: rRNA cytosine-C5-methyltransferase [Alloprevotella sp.]|nr:rRNA cytosine-C5-methyltransferase [Alloprevotella sp.]
MSAERLKAPSSPRPPLPDAFVQEMTALLGTDEATALCCALEDEAPVSIRLNAAKTASLEGEPVGWCADGRYLESRPRFTLDPLFHSGCYYVQEASSMFIEQAVQTINLHPQRVLDLCAAPGGKSTLLRSLLPDDCLLVCNEPIKPRHHILAENLAKWGHPNVAITHNFAHDFRPLQGFFDVILADVPCSGEGMFRKDPASRTEWTPQSPENCATLQHSIIEDIWPCLRQGGFLIYSTCTYNRLEDEDNVKWICEALGAELVPVSTRPEWQIYGDATGNSLPVYHFYPHHARGEGFFLALLKKTAETTQKDTSVKKKQNGLFQQIKDNSLKQYLTIPDNYLLGQANDGFIYALPAFSARDMLLLRQHLHCVSTGLCLFEQKGKKLVPQAELALSTALRTEAFPRVNLSHEEALNYLRRNALSLPEAPHGYVLICYENHPLGFANNLGSRANNLYPKEWSIKNL